MGRGVGEVGHSAMSIHGKKTLAELKSICRERGLVDAGKSSELVRRLEDHDKKKSAPAAAPGNDVDDIFDSLFEGQAAPREDLDASKKDKKDKKDKKEKKDTAEADAKQKEAAEAEKRQESAEAEKRKLAADAEAANKDKKDK